jgi:hypothetical protein
MWFIFISARRFYVRTAQSPPALRPGPAPDRSVVNRPIRRVGLSPTNCAPFAGCCEVICYWPTGVILTALAQRT